MAGQLKVDNINADSNLALKIANTAVAYIDSTGLKPVSGNLVVGGTQVITNGTITANSIANSSFQTGSIENYMRGTGLGFGMRNRIINGAMVIDQRNAGASISAGDGAFGVDRFAMYYQTVISAKGTIQQNAGSVTPPVGFTNYLGFTSNSAYSVASGDAILINQRIEGYNIADLGWGTANAKTVTLSFWVYSSLTGTFGGTLRNAAGTQYYPYSYTISSANTWQQISVTIAGSTTGTWGSTNGIGVYVMFGLGVGSSLQGTANTWSSSAYFSPTGATSVVGTNGATFYITGVQLEVGSTATSFDYRPYGTELVLCQRYYYKILPNASVRLLSTSGQCAATTGGSICTSFPVTMRDRPTALEQSGTASHYGVFNAATGTVLCSVVPAYNNFTTNNAAFVDFTVASGLVAGNATFLFTQNTAAYLGWSAEL